MEKIVNNKWVPVSGLCKPIQDIMIILVSSDPLNLKTGKERQKIEKIEYLENKKNFLDEIKSIFYNF